MREWFKNVFGGHRNLWARNFFLALQRGNQSVLPPLTRGGRGGEAVWTWLPLLALPLLLSGCWSVGPNFHAPTFEAPPDWPQLETERPVTTAEPGPELAVWWLNFNDPKLNELVSTALAENLGVKEAEDEILEARANKGIAASAFWPQINYSAQGQRARSVIGEANNGTVLASTANFFQHGFDAAWELDFFGGTRRAVEAADANIDAAVENKRNVLVTLAAEVGTDYATYCSLREQLKITQENVDAQKKTLALTEKQFKGGMLTMLDVSNARAQVATTSAQLPVLETSLRQTCYALAVLLGREPAALDEELKIAAAVPPAPPLIPSGLPSTLLRRRPDVRNAEALAHAATAQIGVAESAWFPTFSLTGLSGLEGTKSGSLVAWANRFWNWGPSVQWQGYEGGRIVSNIQLQKALFDQSLLTYRQTVLNALQDVDNALVAYAEEKKHYAFLADAVAANHKAVELSLKLYTEGQTDFLNVLTAQLSLYNTEEALAQSRLALTNDVIALYKALGGGWSTEDPPPGSFVDPKQAGCDKK